MLNKKHKLPQSDSKSKYKAKKTIINGIEFDSKLEAQYYQHLLTVYRPEDIKIQVTFEIFPKFRDSKGKAIRCINYIADFVIDNQIVIDVKGSPKIITQDAKIKHKLFKHKYPEFTFTIVYRKAGKWVQI